MMATLSTLCPAIEDRQHRLEVQMLTLGHCAFAGLLTTLIDVSLKGRGLPPFLFNPRQLLGEGSLALVTAKATRGKVQQRHLAPDVQVPNAPLCALMDRIRDLSTPRANRHIVLVFAKDMQYFPLTLFLNRIFRDYQTRQAYQETSGWVQSGFGAVLRGSDGCNIKQRKPTPFGAEKAGRQRIDLSGGDDTEMRVPRMGERRQGEFPTGS